MFLHLSQISIIILWINLAFLAESSLLWVLVYEFVKKFLCTHCSSGPLCPLFLWSHCSSDLTVPLALCTHCSIGSLYPLVLWPSVPTVPLVLYTLWSSIPSGPLYPLVLCTHCSTVPLVLCTHWSSVPTGPLCPLFHCSSGPLYPLFHGSSVPTVPLVLCVHCSSGPLCPLFHLSSAPIVPLVCSAHCSSGLNAHCLMILCSYFSTALLILYALCSSGPLCPLFTDPLYPLTLPFCYTYLLIISYFRTRYMRDYPLKGWESTPRTEPSTSLSGNFRIHNVVISRVTQR